MFAALILSGALVTLSAGVAPPDYTERSLCDLWAGARCHQARCGQDAQSRCADESKRCARASGGRVERQHAAKVAACAKAQLQQACGAPAPAECEGVDGP